MNSETFSPKSFLKARRPDRFSDTTLREINEVDRSLLDYHLSSITNRSQEYDFERFARRLCEREICPNLLPQTGPTGGGDSKVDSETFPVSDDLVLTWHTGLARAASRERWAFAFSAKADWAPKVRSDIKKITETGRGYAKALFVTNQFVPDRRRAEIEDQLTSAFSIDVRILDRSWILDRVFLGNHEDIAIEELKVTALSNKSISKGALDTARELELRELEDDISKTIADSKASTAVVDMALRSADLIRNLEKSKEEIEIAFTRASEFAAKYGSTRQQAEAAYQWGWTLYWWLEDLDRFILHYSTVEERISGAESIYDLEQLFTLWHCLYGAIRQDLVSVEDVCLEERTRLLGQELDRLAKDINRPSTSYQAKIMKLQVDMAIKHMSGEECEHELEQIEAIIIEAQHLVGYPLNPLFESLIELGSIYESSEAYEKLFETIVNITDNREGELAAGRLLLVRGEQYLDHGLPSSAIATLGQALARLYKHESRHDIVKALYMCGCAYEELDLLWAARGTLLSAASIATNDFWSYGDVTPYQAACYNRLKWIELRLGRLPQILAWHELDFSIRSHLANIGYDQETLLTSHNTFSILLGHLLLGIDFFDLRAVGKFPSILDKLDLEIAADALLFMLGYTERLEEIAKEFEEDINDFASNWYALTTDVPSASAPSLYNKEHAELYSSLLGCQITIKCSTEGPCIEVGESLLAALESFLATSTFARAYAHEPKMTMTVKCSHYSETMIQIRLSDEVLIPHFDIVCSRFDPNSVTPQTHKELGEQILESIATIISQFVMFKDFEADLEELIRDERVIDRAISFTATFGTQSNVLGRSPKNKLSSWTNDELDEFSNIREYPWVPSSSSLESRAKVLARETEVAKEPLDSLEKFDLNKLPHSRIRTESLIRTRLWERAKWSGIFFMIDPTGQYLPILAPLFANQETGQRIFIQWRELLGKVDKNELLRISVVRGINKKFPHNYRVQIGMNPNSLEFSTDLVLLGARIHTMEPESSDNLDRFIDAYEVQKRFFLAPAFSDDVLDMSVIPDIDLDLAIGMREFQLRQAWEIGPNDIDAVCIHYDDEPIIPENSEEPPINRLLDKLRNS